MLGDLREDRGREGQRERGTEGEREGSDSLQLSYLLKSRVLVHWYFGTKWPSAFGSHLHNLNSNFYNNLSLL